MTDELRVQGDGLARFSQTHSEIASNLTRLTSSVAPALGVETSHGAIAAAVTTALGDLLGSRTGAFQTTSENGNSLADRLQHALSAYQRDDEQAAGDVNKAGDRMGDTSNSGTQSISGSTTGGTSSGGTGSDIAGQLSSALGQVGQQVGQLGSSLTAPFLGAAQGLQTLPQQVMQSVQGVMQNSVGNDSSAGKLPDGGDHAPAGNPSTNDDPPNKPGDSPIQPIHQQAPTPPPTSSPPPPGNPDDYAKRPRSSVPLD
jgi:hypothetical protein